MRKLIRLFGLLAILAAMSDFARAEAPAAPTVTVGGLVDTYYTYNFTNSANSMNGAGNNTGAYFYNAADSSFTLGLAEVTAVATMGNTSAHLVLADIAGNPTGLTNFGIDVLQAFVSYNPGEWTFTAGKFVTWMGQEVIESKTNWNYTHSLLFQYAIPYWHTGFSAMFMPDAKFMITGYAVNGWNNLASPFIAPHSNLGLTYGLQMIAKPDSTFNFILNGIAGPQGGVGTPTYNGAAHYVGEGIIILNATDKLSFALDFNYGGIDSNISGVNNATFWGAAFYTRYQMESDLAAALRLEEVKDSSNALGMYSPLAPIGTATDVEAREVTLTLEHNFTPNLLGRLEGRMDMALSGGTQYSKTTSSVGSFAGGDGTQTTVTAGMVMSF